MNNSTLCVGADVHLDDLKRLRTFERFGLDNPTNDDFIHSLAVRFHGFNLKPEHGQQFSRLLRIQRQIHELF